MASTKRKEEGGNPAGDERSKKPKNDDDDDDKEGLPTPQSKAGMIQGPDDGTIERLFGALFYSILTFAEANFKGMPYSIPRKEDYKAFFDDITGDYKSYLTSKTLGPKERIIQAAVWKKLVDGLLEVPTTVFVEIPEAKIKKHDLEGFLEWRALTAHFLSNSYKSRTSWGKGGAQRKEFVNETLELLLGHSSLKKHPETLRGQLETIAQHACELAVAMAGSRAYWVCTMEDPRVEASHNFKIRRDRMEKVEAWDEDDECPRTVDFVAAPMLLKHGNSSGENYGTCRVAKKAQVVMMTMGAEAVMKAKKGTD